MKKYCSIIAMLLAMIMAFSAISVSSVSAAGLLGDPAGTGKVGGIKNIQWMQNYLSKNNSDSTGVLYADVYEDGVTDVKDLFAFRMYEANLISGLPYTSTTPVGIDSTYPSELAMLRKFYVNDTINSYYSVLVNQVGYSANAKKIVRITEGGKVKRNSAESLIYGKKAYVVNAETNLCVGVFDIGKQKNFEKKYGSTQDSVFVAEVDISSITKVGTYVIYTPIGKSYEFKITENSNEKVMNDALMALYYNRCGGDISEETIRAYDKYLVDNYGYTSGEYYNNYKGYIRDACHLKSTYKNIGQEVEIVDTYDENTEKFVTNKDANGNVKKYPATKFAYGLHDAGDYARYTEPAAKTLSDLLYAYMLYPEVFTLDVIQDEAVDPNGDVNVPDILDIARWEAKFILNMQSDSEQSKGGFYLKIATERFASANYTLPESDSGFNGQEGTYNVYPGLRVQNVNLYVTAACSAVLADCYTVFKEIDPEFAKQCLTASKAGYTYYYNNINSTDAEAKARNDAQNQRNGDTIGGGPYFGQYNDRDNWWYMNSALYRATGESTYNNIIKTKIDSSYDSSKTMTDMNRYGYVAYYLACKKDKLASADSTVAAKCLEKFTTTSAAYIKTLSKDSCGVFESCYEKWGSNGAMCNSFNVLSLTNAFKTYNTSDTTDYITPNRIGANYFFGVNILGYCMITGWDYSKSTENIHHFPSTIIKTKTNSLTGKKNRCVPGWLAEGYTSYKKIGINPNAYFYYNDSENDYVANEVVIYGNAALLLTLAPVVQEDMQINK